MKVLYDISILGLAQAYPSARTGLFRVVENVAEQLVRHNDCELTFSSSHSMEMVSNSIDYLALHKKLSQVPFSRMPFFMERFKAQRKRYGLIHDVETGKDMPFLHKLFFKAQIRSIWLKEQLFNLSSRDLIHPRDLEGADIYHSPYHAIPEQVRKINKKVVFLTSYDLIPIIAPQYVKPEHTEAFQKILNSITPETWVLCISNDCRNDLLNHLGPQIDPERVKVTELAASESFYQSKDKQINKDTRRKYGIPDGPYVLSLCTLEPRKNIDSVIKAFSQVVAQENLADLHLVLVGSKGWMFDKIFEELQASASIKDKIIVTGYVPDEDLAAIYSDALLFVYPSFYEGFGLPPLEAMQCGTPVITSNTTSLPEVVGDAGIMVAPTDLDALCQAMLSVYNNPALQKELSGKSVVRAKRFSWERCAQETVGAYAIALDR